METEDHFADAASPKARAFVAELEALCVRHKIQLSVSMYDELQLWPLRTGEQPVHVPGIEDRTGDAVLPKPPGDTDRNDTTQKP